MTGPRFSLSGPSPLGSYLFPVIGGALVAAAIFLAPTLSSSAENAVKVPAPATPSEEATADSEKIVLAGGCFWGVQGVFQHVKGVTEAVSGYSGGTMVKPSYEQVSTGTTGHAESVEITFNPRVVSYGKILQIYFSVAHNPTQLNRQGPDEGTQYRSEIFFANEAQQKIALTYIAQLEQAHVFHAPIVTRVDPLKGFYPAEGYHQDFLVRNPRYPYIVYNDLPKIDNLKREFPQIYVDKPVLVAASR